MENNQLHATEYANVFLLTYRQFATARTVLDLLLAGYTMLAKDMSSESLKCRLRYEFRTLHFDEKLRKLKY